MATEWSIIQALTSLFLSVGWWRIRCHSWSVSMLEMMYSAWMYLCRCVMRQQWECL